MQDQIQQRLEVLKREHAAGLDALNELQRREQEIRATLLRISGAIQVLEELLEPPAPPDAPMPPGP